MKDWIQIQITIKSSCTECHKEILPGLVLWSNSKKAARHLSCSHSAPSMDNTHTLDNNIKTDSMASHLISAQVGQVNELKCFVCGLKTGCNECEHLVSCEQRIVCKYCICLQCSTNKENAFNTYQECFAKKAKSMLVKIVA